MNGFIVCEECIILNGGYGGIRCDKHQPSVKPEEECNDIPCTDEEFWGSADFVFPSNVKYNPLKRN